MDTRTKELLEDSLKAIQLGMNINPSLAVILRRAVQLYNSWLGQGVRFKNDSTQLLRNAEETQADT